LGLGVISSVKTPNTSSAAALTVLININTEASEFKKHQITASLIQNWIRNNLMDWKPFKSCAFPAKWTIESPFISNC
jgi:hypothetical protein